MYALCPTPDLALEVLCSLSTRPQRVREIAADLGVTTTECRDLLDALLRRGFVIAVANKTAWIAPYGAAQAAEAAETYWDANYEGNGEA